MPPTHNSLVGIAPLEFIHVLDKNSNISRLEVGPVTFYLRTQEEIVLGPVAMICVPPGAYCKILNPVREYVAGVKCDLALGQTAIKFHGEPFPLYPGEMLSLAPTYGKGGRDCSGALEKLPVVAANWALKLRALQDHKEGKTLVPAGHTWHVKGPRTYIPRPEVEIVEMVAPDLIKVGEVLRLRATQDTVDQNGKTRVTGEEWLVKTPGAYVRDVWEEVVGIERSYTLKVDTGLHLRATQNITTAADGKKRFAGDEWLVTGEQMEEYNPQVGIEVVKKVKLHVVKKGQYAVIMSPIGADGKNQLGKKVLRVGLCSFFLQPGEQLENGKIQNAIILTEDESIVVQATENFVDTFRVKDLPRLAGQCWMIRGPASFIPPITVKVVARRNTIPLAKNDGIYVQNTKTGQVRAVMGPCAYMLTAEEELWHKVLPPSVETLLLQGGGSGSAEIRKMAYFEQAIDPSILEGRDKSRVVTYRCPGNTAVQVNNYVKKTSRVIFGPDLVVLGPDENFNVLGLSAGKPKVVNALKSLCLMLGPDFITEIMEVETSDHARLRVQVSFNNYFEVDKKDPVSVQQIFAVPDFIGFACNQLGSRIRAMVALTPFDEFHRHSANIIQSAVFGRNKDGQLNSSLKFEANNLVVSSIDIQSIEPVDTKMRDSLMKSVQLAIEISTRSVEASAEHEASRREQISRGQLERQRLQNEVEAEKERAKLYELRAEAAAVESSGQAKAEAQAEAEKTLIECQSEISAVTLKAKAEEIEHYSKLETQAMLRKSEMDYKRKLNQLQIKKEKSQADVEVTKFSKMVSTLGADTITKIARAGPQNKLNMLSALGMQSVLLTDGTSPINLFNTAEGLVGGAEAKTSA